MKKFIMTSFIVLSFLTGCQGSPETSSPIHKSEQDQLITAKVVKSIDGDTIKVRFDGRDETVRLLLIDTPETHHPKLGVQPYGKEAAAFTKSFVEGKSVQLEPAVNRGRDKYGRLLAYVFVGNQSLEEELLKRGLARVAYVYPPNTKYLETYRQDEKDAKEKGLGVWHTKGYAQKDGFHPEVMSGTARTVSKELGFAPDTNGECGQKIKGNINSRGQRIYHILGDPSYKMTKAERCFKTTEEAVKAGFRAPR